MVTVQCTGLGTGHLLWGGGGGGEGGATHCLYGFVELNKLALATTQFHEQVVGIPERDIGVVTIYAVTT